MNVRDTPFSLEFKYRRRFVLIDCELWGEIWAGQHTELPDPLPGFLRRDFVIAELFSRLARMSVLPLHPFSFIFNFVF